MMNGRWAYIGLAALAGILLTACAPAPKKDPAPEAALTPAPIVKPRVLDNGVVYFEATGQAYLDALQAFYGDNGNGDLHCDYQGATEKVVREGRYANSRTAHTEITGHILHCHDMAIDADRVTLE